MAAAMHQRGVGKDAVNDGEQQEIVERLVGNPPRTRVDRPQSRQILVGQATRRLGVGRDAPQVGARDIAMTPELQFASRGDLRMARQDLLGERATRPWQADDQDRGGVVHPRVGLPIAKALRRGRDQTIDTPDKAFPVEVGVAAPNSIALLEVLHGQFAAPHVVRPPREARPLAMERRHAGSGQRRVHPRDERTVGGREFAVRRNPGPEHAHVRGQPRGVFEGERAAASASNT